VGGVQGAWAPSQPALVSCVRGGADRRGCCWVCHGARTAAGGGVAGRGRGGRRVDGTCGHLAAWQRAPATLRTAEAAPKKLCQQCYQRQLRSLLAQSLLFLLTRPTTAPPARASVPPGAAHPARAQQRARAWLLQSPPGPLCTLHAQVCRRAQRMRLLAGRLMVSFAHQELQANADHLFPLALLMQQHLQRSSVGGHLPVV